MSFDRMAEWQIRQAQERGDFDRLEGLGKPLDAHDLSGLDAAERFQAVLARSVGGAPEEVLLYREIETLRAHHARETEPARQQALINQIRALALRLSLLHEKAGRFLAAKQASELIP